jgi:hypothetical protein
VALNKKFENKPPKCKSGGNNYAKQTSNCIPAKNKYFEADFNP